MSSEFVRSTALPHLEARRSCQENTCYRPHAHDAFSVGLVEAGTSVFTAPSGDTVQLRAGDVVVIAAGQVHQCNPRRGPWQYQMVHVDQEWAAAQAVGTGAGPLLKGVTVLRDARAHQRFLEWSELLFSRQPDGEGRAAEAETIQRGFRGLARALAEAAPVHTVLGGGDDALLERVLPVLQRLRDDETNPRLDELARLVGLSRFQLIRAVKSATGLAPLAWRQDQRITRARHLLRRGTPVTEVAHTLGFADQSHFHRVFRAHVAATPSTYRG
ncbi:AraC-type DNA-binding protein [Quadrisphaera granulorum]|uniref:AraC-like DNA-binding protein n=1 Tax=Quadrisphaera granulorum TaxID=317664 RepID=A0A315ZPF2_9ACTN|nr:AraC family transcriptional regulator [Quadrisphaera granulorum]PWJ46983.1 AraC-like DNA-binding protein [Quadrisphaera granulorum]SZE98979.1 AraC-type DNA-binding protein [Quadrisphaera granulorum]